MKTITSTLCVVSLSALLMLSGCGGGGGGGSDAGPTPDNGTQNPVGVSLDVTGGSEFAADGTLSLRVAVSELNNDDAIYLSVQSDDVDSQAMSVSPQQSVIYPTDGDVDVTLTVKNNSLTANPTLSVTVVTAGNVTLTKDISISL
ncbi:hypothetical protein A9Q81_18035 [Gammaproteobacteria bacterium 42_54_T18]|nr:hypothetical protein A9Q81_18035 [Gammaproteobacteria bacterium 42_54_T18]